MKEQKNREGQEKGNWNKVWDNLLSNRLYREKVRICRTQEEVDRAMAAGLPVVGLEEGNVRLKNCTYIWQPEDNSPEEEPADDFLSDSRPAEDSSAECQAPADTDSDCPVPDDLLLLAYCRHFGIPMRIRESRRLILRELSMEDLPELEQIYREPGMTDYIDPLPEGAEEREELSVYISKVYGLYNYGLWAVTDRVTGNLIGRAGVESKPGFPEDTVELGYQIAPHLWGRGYGREAVRAVLSFVREELPSVRRVIARVRPGNAASIRILKREGFDSPGSQIRNGIFRGNAGGKSHPEGDREPCQGRLFELNL
jgi:RimJ/RimL family protein N-acetyltransferase